MIEKLYPEFKDYLWGGNRLVERFSKKCDKNPCAESWELSFHPDGLTRIASGKTLKEAVVAEDLGLNVAGFSDFPLLIKLIDAKSDLSVQVHPDDEYALRYEGSFGKTEMWYIVDADAGAGIYLGFRDDVSRECVEEAIKQGTLTELLNFYEVKPGDCFFIPAGTVHAIGRGCLILEIQENSNLTYRVYDYNRVDKNGRLRELHVEKALAVMSTKRFEPQKFPDGYLGISRHFTVRRFLVDGELVLSSDKNSFLSLTVTRGSGEISDKKIDAGDSFFISADNKIKLTGKMEVVVTEMRKYCFGIDIGGTFIKGAIVDDKGCIVVSSKVPTESDLGPEKVVSNIRTLCDMLLEKSGMKINDLIGVGVGVPGMIDSKTGIVVYSNNLNWYELDLAKMIGDAIGLPVKMGNDANVAALGENKYGIGKNFDSTVMLTLGTGVGGGIIIDGKIIEGTRGAGAELGHSVIMVGGEQCTCGRRGCLEAYASATAIIRDTKRAMTKNPSSPMWQIGSLDNVTGKTAFDYYDTDDGAREVVDNYIKMLACGIVNIANELRPEAIILGGGVCAQGDNLIKPLKKLVNEEIYAADKGPELKIMIASLENDAGCLGAAALFMD